MKKLLTVLLSAMLLLSVGLFAACGPSGGDGEDQDSSEVKVIKVWLHKSEAEPEGIAYKALVDNFNKMGVKTADGKRTIRIRLDYKNDADSILKTLAAEALAGNLPDILPVDAPNVAEFVDAGYLEAIDGYLDAEAKASYVDSVIEQSTIDGSLYALSGMDAPAGLYYNKNVVTRAVLTEAGVADYGTVEKPWSWEELLKVMRVLKGKNSEDVPYKIMMNFGFGGTEGPMYLYSQLVTSAGGSFFTQDNKAVGALDSEASLNGVRVLEDICRGDAGDDWLDDNAGETALASGKVAFEIYGPWLINSINRYNSEFNDSYGIMPVPVIDPSKGAATPCGSYGFGVTTQSKDAASAAIVCAYLTGKDASKLLFESIGTFPTHKSLYTEMEEFTEGEQAEQLTALADLLMQSGTPRPKTVKYQLLSNAYMEIVHYVRDTVNSSDYDLAAYAKKQAQSVDLIA